MTGAALAVERATLRLGTFILRDLDLALDRGEILVVFGPNGAGKSVSLEMIAGFHRPRRGRITIDGREVTHLPPERRRVGLVVQDFGLFPHMTVARNVGFCRAGGGPAGLLAKFGIAHLAERMPQALSAGEKQRTALARALARQPKVFLFDEPFSALDARSWGALRDELKSLLRQTGIPAIFVTHDPEDAWVLADRVAIMRAGAIVQTGTVETVFRKPVDAWVADFVGVDNIVPGRIAERSPYGCRVAVGAAMFDAATAIGASEVLACIRAEGVDMRRAGAEPVPGWLAARVTAVARLGASEQITLDCGFPLKTVTTARRVRELQLSVGAAVAVWIDPDAVHLVPAGTKERPTDVFGPAEAHLFASHSGMRKRPR